ncbi:MAG: hypothetical protein JJE04_10300 [Acidobacteriia bacterium]|nr:hypothetical protein [Terriglobia bacterium]
MKTSFVLPLLLLGAAGHGTIALAQSPGTFSVTGRMTTPRLSHTATLLPSGKVLVAGGLREIASRDLNPILATAELYDPSTGAFTATGNMTTPRASHTATLLPDGRVLIAGGRPELFLNYGPPFSLASAELYDPSTGAFTATGDMIAARDSQGATLLTSGKVLIAGGTAPNAELYDPATGRFSPTGKYSSRPSDINTGQAAVSTLLQDGRVLIVWEQPVLGVPAPGGVAAELYDPDSDTFTATGTTIALSHHEGLPSATLLMNGKVLVAGGATENLFRISAELYDSLTGTFTATGNMTTGHVRHTATLLPDGTVLLAGSYLFESGLATAEIYGPATGTFAATGNMITAQRNLQAATLLNNGQVLFTGGVTFPYTITSSAEIYHPAVLAPAPQLFSLSGDGRGQGAILHAGTARVVTASDPGVPGEVLEIYSTGLQDGSVIPPQVAIGGRLAEILFFGNAPGFIGLNQVNVRVPSGVTPGAGVPVRLTYLGRPSNAVTIGVQ